MIIPKQKIKVFISSACGDDPSKQKYNLVRVGLKALIESTHFAEVYVFESEGASTTSAVQHYTFALEDCDVCIFLIDNKDGIPNGVQVEIDAANKYGIKSLYYFCDQSSKEETPLQRSLKGANHAKSKTVHSFEDFIQSGATDLIDDLVLMYKHYCKGRLAWNEAKTNEKTDNILLSDYSVFSDNVAHKDVLTNIDYCKSYFSQLILGHHPIKEVTNTSAIDKLCVGFLPVIFGGEQVDTNKLEMLKSELEKQQTKSHFSVTQKRLDAINVFYKGDLNGCISILDDALKLAKSELVPSWIINDILIDLRNQERCLEESQNHFYWKVNIRKS
jgi:hypothetical protein